MKALFFLFSFMLTSFASYAYANEVSFELTAPERPQPSPTGLVQAKSLPADLSMSGGSLSVNLPLEAPSGFCPILFDFKPHWSPYNGLSSFGMGFKQRLYITRTNWKGEIGSKSDVFQTPFGELTLGDEGVYYGIGPQNLVEFKREKESWIAVGPFGLRYEFEPYLQREDGLWTKWRLAKVLDKYGHGNILSYKEEASWPILQRIECRRPLGAGYDEVRFHSAPLQVKGQDDRYVFYHLGVKEVMESLYTSVSFHREGREKSVLRYDFTFEKAPYTKVPYLASSTAIYHDNKDEKDPALRFTWNHLSPAGWQFKETDKWSEYLASFPHGSSPYFRFFDMDQDGHMELESPFDFSLWSKDGEDVEYLTQVDQPDGDCLFWKSQVYTGRKPRDIVVLAPETAPLVVVRKNFALVFCHRDGSLAKKVDLPVYAKGVRLLLADVNQDRKVDILYVGKRQIQIWENQSEKEALAFSSSPRLLPTKDFSFWARDIKLQMLDMNGDRQVDLVIKKDDRLLVFYHLGQFKFSDSPREFLFKNRFGSAYNLSSYQTGFLDGSRDGLIDMVATGRNGNTVFFVNDGLNLTEVSAPMPMSGSFLRKMLGDPFGRGSLSVLQTGLDGKLSTLSFHGPETGLLAQISSDSGVKTRYTWGFSEAIEKVGVRIPVIKSVEKVYEKGENEIEALAFSEPYVEDDRFLGFKKWHHSTPKADEWVQADYFLGVDPYVIERKRKFKAAPHLSFMALNRWAKKSVFGVDRYLKTQKEDVILDEEAKQRVSSKTSYHDYDGLCPGSIIKESSTAKLETKLFYEAFPVLGHRQTCLATKKRQIALHQDSELDFEREVRASYSKLFDLEQIWEGDSSQEKVEYTPDGLIGTYYDGLNRVTKVQYDDKRRPFFFETWDGQAWQLSFDEASYLNTSQKNNNGFGAFYDYDGKNRLSGMWNSLYGAAGDPLRSYRYKESSFSEYGYVLHHKKWGKNISQASVELWSGDGTFFARGAKKGEVWAFGGIELRDPTKGTIQNGGYKVIGDLGTSSIDSLRDSGVLGRTKSVNGWVYDVYKLLREDVGFEAKTQISVLNEGIVFTSRVNKERLSRVIRNMDGQVIEVKEPGIESVYAVRDALGRVRKVYRGSGGSKGIFVTYDKEGRKTGVLHEGLGRVSYVYGGDNRLNQKSVALVGENRDIFYEYDNKARLKRESYIEGSRRFDIEHFYDGNLDDGRKVQGQLGYKSQVATEDLEKVFLNNKDGQRQHEKVVFPSGVAIEISYFYNSYGVLESKILEFSRLGILFDRVMLSYEYDQNGMVSYVGVNDSGVALKYDKFGALTEAVFSESEYSKYLYDPMTRNLTGRKWVDGAQAYEYGYEINGFSETVRDVFSLGNREVVREYGYNEAGFLVSSLQEGRQKEYEYDKEYFLKSGDFEGSGFFRKPKVLNGFEIEYGPHGRIQYAVKNGRSIRYGYDEGLHLVSKVDNFGNEVYFLDGIKVENGRVSFDIEVLGGTAARYENGVLKRHMEDVRETSIFEGDGFLLPYGEMGFEGKKGGRYAGAYFDWDLGVYSFGVRRYSPDLGRFISVDPLFLERPGLCLGSPVECNLYSYGKNNPLKYVDPTGTIAWIPVIAAAYVAVEIADTIVGIMDGASGNHDGLRPAGMNPVTDMIGTYQEGQMAKAQREAITLSMVPMSGKSMGKNLGKSLNASDLPLLKKGTEAWNKAVESLKGLGKGKINVRTQNATDAKSLLQESRGNMNRHKNYTDQNYNKGYETHNSQNARELGAGNDLQHLKWKDGKAGGHIYYDNPN